MSIISLLFANVLIAHTDEIARAHFDASIRAAVAAWRAGLPMPVIQLESDAAAELFRADFVSALETEWGAQIGFKAALTNPAAQQRFGIGQPVLGVLLEGMLLPNAATVSIRRASRMMVEADLLVLVRDDSINEAETDEEIAAALSYVSPFVELADGMFQPDQHPPGRALIAYNAGARLGVRGAWIPMPNVQTGALYWLRSLAVELIGPHGSTIGHGRATDLLGDPIRSVRWIRDEARRIGYRFEGGEHLSLGSITPPLPVSAPGRYVAKYDGMPLGAESVEVILTDP